MFNLSPLEISDFSGGITENFIEAAPSRAEIADNFLITENKKLYTRNGSKIYSDDYPQLPSGLQRIGDLFNFSDNLIVRVGKSIYRDSGTSWEVVRGPTLGDPLEGTLQTDNACFTQWNEHLFVTSDKRPKLHKIFKDENGVWRALTAGLPKLSAAPVVTGTTDLTNGANYIYAFVLSYEYTVGDVTYLDYGPTLQVQKLNMLSPNTDPVSITGIPTLVNTASTNYDVTNIKVEIYRTVANGTTLYRIGSVVNGTSTFTDNFLDSSVQNQLPLYTTGGVLDNDEPPKAKYIHATSGVCFYGNIIDSYGNILLNRIVQSVVGDPDSVPEGNYVDVDREVTAISSYMDRPIVFSAGEFYRLEGLYDDTGLGGITANKVSDTIGCISPKSVVQTPVGLFFVCKEGFAYTDGFKAFTVSNNFNKKFRSLISSEEKRKRIYGTFDKENNRVYWSVQDTEEDCDRIFVLDLRWGITENSSFTTFSGGSSFAPTSILYKDNRLLRGDKRGYIFSHDDGLLSDPKINTIVLPSAWGIQAIPYRWKSSAFKFGGAERSYVPKVIVSAKNSSNLSLQINSDSDIGNKERELKPIRWRGNFIWDDPLFFWDDPMFRWGEQGFIEEQRMFHSNDLRCTYKQLELIGAEVVIVRSDVIGTAQVDPTAKTVLLEDITQVWPDDMSGHKIYFEVDGYERGYEVVSQSSDMLTVLDPEGSLPAGSNRWELWGVPKDEVLSLLAVTLLFSPLGDTQQDYSKASAGRNS